MALIIREFSKETDIPGLLQLFGEAEAVDHVGYLEDVDSLNQQLSLTGDDPNHVRWVMPHPDDPAKFLGFAVYWMHPEKKTARFDLLIHPDWRRQGLGTQLTTTIIENCHNMGGIFLEVSVDTKIPSSEAYLQKAGFQPQGSYHEMRKMIPARLPTPVWPYGYQVRTYAEVQDITALTYAMNVSYEGLWGHQEVTEDQMSSWLQHFRQDSLFLVYSPSGKLVGISRVDIDKARSMKNDIPTGYIDAPGFHHHHRRMDLYRALLLQGMHWLQNQNQEMVEMESWGEKKEILNLYLDMGFETIRTRVTYRLLL